LIAGEKCENVSTVVSTRNLPTGGKLVMDEVHRLGLVRLRGRLSDPALTIKARPMSIDPNTGLHRGGGGGSAAQGILVCKPLNLQPI
jgi:hypothetical protein